MLTLAFLSISSLTTSTLQQRVAKLIGVKPACVLSWSKLKLSVSSSPCSDGQYLLLHSEESEQSQCVHSVLLYPEEYHHPEERRKQ